MIDEDKLSKATGRAVRAQNLLADELLVEAFQKLEEAYTAAWRTTKTGESDAREKLFMAVNIVGKVQEHLTKIVIDGKLAAAELKEIAETAERKRLFGVRRF